MITAPVTARAASGTTAPAPAARTTGARTPASREAVPGPAGGLLAQARAGLTGAAHVTGAGERYAAAHLAALRAAAAVLAARAAARARTTPRSVWELLPRVAPELAEWAAFFGAVAGKRTAAEAGLPGAVTAREADDLVRDAAEFTRIAGAVLAGPRPDRRRGGPGGGHDTGGSPGSLGTPGGATSARHAPREGRAPRAPRAPRQPHEPQTSPGAVTASP